MIVALSLAFSLLAQNDGLGPPVDRIVCPREVVLPTIPSARQAPVINLEIGGKTYRFALDTGAVGGRISEEVVKSLGLKPVGIIQAGDPSGKHNRVVSIYKIPEIKAGDATLYGVRMMADSGVAPKGTAAYFDGVIGYAVFHDVLLTLDYPHSRVVLKPGGMSRDQLSASLPYELEHGIPFMQVQVGKVKVGGHVDSGSDGELSIPAKFKPDLNLQAAPVLVGHARTLFNTVDIYAAKVKDRILVGGLEMPIHQIELNDLFPFANIGGRLLRKFSVSIDQGRKRILFAAP